MNYTVPQFIERETKIAGPFNFKQLIFLVSTFVADLFIYNFLPFWLFIVLGGLITLTALALIFVKINGIPLTTIIKNFFLFLGKPKLYLWQRKGFSPKVVKIDKNNALKNKNDKTSSPTISLAEKSSLKKVAFFIETKTK
jgi:hypothetical protein